MTFTEMLKSRWAQGRFVCVGLDTSPEKIPSAILDPDSWSQSWILFNIALIDATARLALAFKPNLAFYLAKGSVGVNVLEATCRYIKKTYPDVAIILDMKSADIDSTNDGYATFAFDICGANAITVHHKHGMLAMKPYLDRIDKGIIVVVRTSNKGADEFQNVEVNVPNIDVDKMVNDRVFAQRYPAGNRLPSYLYEAWRVRRHWNMHGNCAVVAGATNEGLARVRQIVGDDMPILIPGIGAQGGQVEPTVKAGRNSRGQGMIINSSRGIIYASSGADFAEAAAAETQRLTDLINQYRMEGLSS